MLFLLPQTIQAITISDVGSSLDLGSRSPEEIAISIINWVLGILSIIAVIIVIYAGFLWMTANGNPDKVEKAKKTLISAIIGLLIILASWGIVWYILNRLIDATGGNNGGGQCSVNADCADGQQCCYPSRICATSCSGFPQNSNFYVVSTWPRNMETNVYLCTAMSARFSKEINKATVTNETYYVQVYAGAPNNTACIENNDCASSLCESNICVGDRAQGIIKFGPGETTKYADLILNTDLEMNTTYIATIEGNYDGVRALDGTVLSTDGIGEYTWTFSTGEETDVIPPVVKENNSSPFPADGSVDACLKTPLYTQFSEAMLPSSFNDTVAVNLSAGSDFVENLALGSWDFGGLFDVFMTRPKEQLMANTSYFVRLFGGTAEEIYNDAPLDMCANPLDGDHDGDLDTEGSPMDDFISSDDTETPNVTPWNFETGIIVDCFPEITSFTPEASYYGVDNDPLGPSLSDNGGGIADPGRVTIVGKYFLPEPEVIFFDTVWAGRTIESCFNQNFTIGPPNNNPILGEAGNKEYIEGMCLMSASVGEIDIKVPPLSKEEGSLAVSVAGITSDPSEADFEILSPHIDYTDPSSGGVGQYVTIGGDNFGSEQGQVWFRRREEGGGTTDILGNWPDDPRCTANWTNKEIITVVPTGFELDNKVEIQVVRANGKYSNTRNFKITDKVGPGLCLINPHCHETAGQFAEFVGEKFGLTPGVVHGVNPAINYHYFGDETDQYFEAQSNTGLVNGRYFVRVTKEQDGETLRSNGRAYSIPCNKAPRVRDYADCAGGEPEDGLYPSPSPRPNVTNACLNSMINLVFEINSLELAAIDQATLTNNIDLYKCNIGGTYDYNTCLIVTASIPSTILYENETAKAVGIRLVPSGLEINTWYMVNVDKDVSTTDGVPMEDNYQYHFRTQADDSQCPIQSVSVDARNIDQAGNVIEGGYGNNIIAGNVFMSNLPATQLFEAIPRGPDCQHIDGSGYSFVWDSSEIAIANMVAGSTWRELATALSNAQDGRSQIEAEVQSVSGNASLVVDSAYCTSNADCAECGSICDIEINRCLPIVTGMCPVDGPVGQWTTLTGCYFGWQKGEVYFDSNLADYPDKNICGNTWTSNQIIAQVPEVAPGNDFSVEVSFDYPFSNKVVCEQNDPEDENSGYSISCDQGMLSCLEGALVTGETPACSDEGIAECQSGGVARCTKKLTASAGDFTVNSDPIGPMLCKVQPTAADNGATVVLRGKNFGIGTGGEGICEKDTSKACSSDADCQDISDLGACEDKIVQVCQNDSKTTCQTDNDCIFGTPPAALVDVGPCEDQTIKSCHEDDSKVCSVDSECILIENDKSPCSASNPETDNQATFMKTLTTRAEPTLDDYYTWSETAVTVAVPVDAISGNPSICANNAFDISDAGILVEKGSSVSNPLAFGVTCKENSDCDSDCCQHGFCQLADQCEDSNFGQPCINNCSNTFFNQPSCQVDDSVTCEVGSAYCQNDYACLNAIPQCIDGSVDCQLGNPACSGVASGCSTGVPICYPSNELSCITGDSNCLCCCDPTEPDPTNIWGLLCTPDIEPCTAEDDQRGAFCGCTTGACSDDSVLCRTDSDCSGEGATCKDIVPNDYLCNSNGSNYLSCGSDDCCHSRPVVAYQIPEVTTEVCPNAKLQLIFSQPMNEPGLRYAVDGTIKVLVGDEFQEGEIYMHNQGYQNQNVTYVDILLNNMLPKLATVDIFVSRDVANEWGIKMGDAEYHFEGENYNVDGDYIYTFNTRAEICTVSGVYMDPPSYIFTEANVFATGGAIGTADDEKTNFTAITLSDDDQILASYPSYGWDWEWSPSVGEENIAWIVPPIDEGDIAPDYISYAKDGDQNGQINAIATAANIGGEELRGCAVAEDCGVGYDCLAIENTHQGYDAVCVAQGITYPLCNNNDECQGANNYCQQLEIDDGQIGVNLVVGDYYVGSCAGSDLEAMSLLDVFLCENPWPVSTGNDLEKYKFFPVSEWGRNQPGDIWPVQTGDDDPNNLIEDDDYHFTTMYCLDDGLPNLDLKVKKITDLPTDGPETLAMYFLTKFDDDSEIIGIRVFTNPNNLSVADWYKKNVKNGGTYSQSTVDGFDAIQTGNSTFISASNLTDSGQIYSNVYLISATAGGDTLQIYTQLVANLHFQTGLVDLDKKAQMQRDTARIMAFGDMQTRLGDYYLTGGSYNFLSFATGAYLRGYSNSLWNSWSTLGNAMGKNYTDPINKMDSSTITEALEADQAKSCFEMNLSYFNNSSSSADYYCLETGIVGLPGNYYNYERVEDVPVERICGGEGNEIMCCPENQECLQAEVIEVVLDQVLVDCEEDTLAEKYCSFGESPQCCAGADETCQQVTLDDGKFATRCVKTETKQECFDSDLLTAIKTAEIDNNNNPICCNPLFGQSLNGECVACAYLKGVDAQGKPVVFDDTKACWSTDAKRHLLPAEESYTYLYKVTNNNQKVSLYANLEFQYEAEGVTWGGDFDDNYAGDNDFYNPCDDPGTNDSACRSYNYRVEIEAYDEKRIHDLAQIRSALTKYYQTNGHYPIIADPTIWVGSEADDPNEIFWNELSNKLLNYLSPLPRDPVDNCVTGPWNYENYCYAYRSDSTGGAYDLIGQLEDENNLQTCKYACWENAVAVNLANQIGETFCQGDALECEPTDNPFDFSKRLISAK